MNAVIYARYSSQGQNEQSIDGQLRICHEFAERMGLRVIHEYIDKAKTAFKDTDKRIEFNKMLKDSEQGKFKVIIVYMLDRFSRNRAESMLTKMKLLESGVKVLSAQENISDTEEGQFFEMFLEYNAEMYSKRLSKRVRHGLDTSVDNGTFTGGHMQYGYKVNDNNKIEIEQEKAGILKFVFEKYSIGWSKHEIATALNEQGKRYKNKLFIGRDFDKWLVSEKYTGSYKFGDRICDKTYPQIIDKRLFDLVQKQLIANKKNCGAKTTPEPYLLNGKIKCGHCGEYMIADSGTNHLGEVYKYYICKNIKKRKAKCNKKREKKLVIEYYVTERIVAYLSDSELVREFAERMVTWYDDKTGQRALKSIESQIVALKKQKENAVDLMIANSHDKETVDGLRVRINDIAGQVNDLQNQYDDLEYMAGMKLKVEHIVEFINKFIKGNLTDPVFQERLIKNLLNCIYVYDDKFVLYFNLTNRKEVIFVGLDETDEITDTANGGTCSNVITYSPPDRENISSYVSVMCFA